MESLRSSKMDVRYNYIDPLAVIYNEGYWRLNKVSPMTNMRYSAVKMKQYASIIRQALVRDVAASPNVQFTVNVDILPLLRFAPDDPYGLMVEVITGLTNKVTYVAILLSWGVNINLLDGVHLPYMLERGDQKVGVTVKATMQAIFDCNISQFHFTQLNLIKFGFDFVQNDSSRNTDPFVLTYKTPQVNLKDKMTIAFEIGDVRAIWNRVNELSEDPVTEAYQILQNQIYFMFTLDITILDLFEVTLPKAEVKSNGVVKMRTPEMINVVFTVLNDIRR